MNKKLTAIVFVLVLSILYNYLLPISYASASSAQNYYNLGNVTLKNGSTGPAARELQRFLNDRLNLGLVLDGKIGSKTIAVMKKWQKENDLVADGLIGPKTKALMNFQTQQTNTRATVSTNTSTTTQPNSTSPNMTILNSSFFNQDQTAIQIATEKLKDYSIKQFDIMKANNTDNFAFKFLSGLREIGYVSSGGSSIGYYYPGYYSVRVLNFFQKDYNLPQTDIITKDALSKLDSILYSNEAIEKQNRDKFPLCSEFGQEPKNWPTKEHLCNLYFLVFKSLPDYLIPWTENNFSNFFSTQYTNPTRQQIDLNYYGGSMEYRTSMPRIQSDLEAMDTLLHEYAHYVEGSEILNWQTGDYYSISWETVRGDNGKGILMGTDQPKYTINDDAWLTSYAIPMAGESKHREDFAEGFAMYVLEGKVFRDRASESPIIKAKYDWLKNNVFNGREYNTGNSNWKSIDFNPNSTNQAIKHRAGHPSDYSTYDPSYYRWDYKLNTL